jgi:hypothetical protein
MTSCKSMEDDLLSHIMLGFELDQPEYHRKMQR